jgi:hypothetical protein
MKKAQSLANEQCVRRAQSQRSRKIENATAEFRTKCFWSAMCLRIAFTGLFGSHAELIRATLLKSNLKSLKITCAAFLPGAIDTPGPG